MCSYETRWFPATVWTFSRKFFPCLELNHFLAFPARTLSQCTYCAIRLSFQHAHIHQSLVLRLFALAPFASLYHFLIYALYFSVSLSLTGIFPFKFFFMGISYMIYFFYIYAHFYWNITGV